MERSVLCLCHGRFSPDQVPRSRKTSTSGWGPEQWRFRRGVCLGWLWWTLSLDLDGDALLAGYVFRGVGMGTFHQDRKRGWHRLKPHRYGFRMVGRKSLEKDKKPLMLRETWTPGLEIIGSHRNCRKE
ncbi:hypothetical protein QQP08_010130 [Theobroma cacao]|uniref:Uncharacterized protein n=1 Tax=Theobroma cacao TaxID=3641 RepID=A0A061FWU2_THECC|nr:Uncharacterized protein TCM_013820 [Theobroma cacao]WRX17643.1 hypothetical protein QQP08_010130 [Theobroma cacao]